VAPPKAFPVFTLPTDPFVCSLSMVVSFSLRVFLKNIFSPVSCFACPFPPGLPSDALLTRPVTTFFHYVPDTFWNAPRPFLNVTTSPPKSLVTQPSPFSRSAFVRFFLDRAAAWPGSFPPHFQSIPRLTFPAIAGVPAFSLFSHF